MPNNITRRNLINKTHLLFHVNKQVTKDEGIKRTLCYFSYHKHMFETKSNSYSLSGLKCIVEKKDKGSHMQVFIHNTNFKHHNRI